MAEGATRRFSRKVFGHCNVVEGVEVRVKLVSRIVDDVFYTIHGPDFSRRLFAWIVPVEGGREAVIGVGGRGSLDVLVSILSRLERQGFASIAGIISRRAGLIVLGPPVARIRRGRVLGVGDSICASKPFTGGGLYAISVIGPVVASALEKDDLGLVDTTWINLRDELWRQWIATRVAKILEASPWIWWRLINLICKCQNIDFDEHTSVLRCLAGV